MSLQKQQQNTTTKYNNKIQQHNTTTKHINKTQQQKNNKFWDLRTPNNNNILHQSPCLFLRFEDPQNQYNNNNTRLGPEEPQNNNNKNNHTLI